MEWATQSMHYSMCAAMLCRMEETLLAPICLISLMTRDHTLS